ncbi:MAG: hypothetical protein RR951_08675, partial [Ruthenibacterium sp.]
AAALPACPPAVMLWIHLKNRRSLAVSSAKESRAESGRQARLCHARQVFSCNNNFTTSPANAN